MASNTWIDLGFSKSKLLALIGSKGVVARVLAGVKEGRGCPRQRAVGIPVTPRRNVLSIGVILVFLQPVLAITEHGIQEASDVLITESMEVSGASFFSPAWPSTKRSSSDTSASATWSVEGTKKTLGKTVTSQIVTFSLSSRDTVTNTQSTVSHASSDNRQHESQGPTEVSPPSVKSEYQIQDYTTLETGTSSENSGLTQNTVLTSSVTSPVIYTSVPSQTAFSETSSIVTELTSGSNIVEHPSSPLLSSLITTPPHVTLTNAISFTHSNVTSTQVPVTRSAETSSASSSSSVEIPSPVSTESKFTATAEASMKVSSAESYSASESKSTVTLQTSAFMSSISVVPESKGTSSTAIDEQTYFTSVVPSSSVNLMDNVTSLPLSTRLPSEKESSNTVHTSVDSTKYPPDSPAATSTNITPLSSSGATTTVFNNLETTTEEITVSAMRGTTVLTSSSHNSSPSLYYVTTVPETTKPMNTNATSNLNLLTTKGFSSAVTTAQKTSSLEAEFSTGRDINFTTSGMFSWTSAKAVSNNSNVPTKSFDHSSSGVTSMMVEESTATSGSTMYSDSVEGTVTHRMTESSSSLGNILSSSAGIKPTTKYTTDEKFTASTLPFISQTLMSPNGITDSETAGQMSSSSGMITGETTHMPSSASSYETSTVTFSDVTTKRTAANSPSSTVSISSDLGSAITEAPFMDSSTLQSNVFYSTVSLSSEKPSNSPSSQSFSSVAVAETSDTAQSSSITTVGVGTAVYHSAGTSQEAISELSKWTRTDSAVATSSKSSNIETLYSTSISASSPEWVAHSSTFQTHSATVLLSSGTSEVTSSEHEMSSSLGTSILATTMNIADTSASTSPAVTQSINTLSTALTTKTLSPGLSSTSTASEHITSDDVTAESTDQLASALPSTKLASALPSTKSTSELITDFDSASTVTYYNTNTDSVTPSSEEITGFTTPHEHTTKQSLSLETQESSESTVTNVMSLPSFTSISFSPLTSLKTKAVTSATEVVSLLTSPMNATEDVSSTNPLYSATLSVFPSEETTSVLADTKEQSTFELTSIGFGSESSAMSLMSVKSTSLPTKTSLKTETVVGTTEDTALQTTSGNVTQIVTVSNAISALTLSTSPSEETMTVFTSVGTTKQSTFESTPMELTSESSTMPLLSSSSSLQSTQTSLKSEAVTGATENVSLLTSSMNATKAVTVTNVLSSVTLSVSYPKETMSALTKTDSTEPSTPESTSTGFAEESDTLTTKVPGSFTTQELYSNSANGDVSTSAEVSAFQTPTSTPSVLEGVTSKATTDVSSTTKGAAVVTTKFTSAFGITVTERKSDNTSPSHSAPLSSAFISSNSADSTLKTTKEVLPTTQTPVTTNMSYTQTPAHTVTTLTPVTTEIFPNTTPLSRKTEAAVTTAQIATSSTALSPTITAALTSITTTSTNKITSSGAQNLTTLITPLASTASITAPVLECHISEAIWVKTVLSLNIRRLRVSVALTQNIGKGLSLALQNAFNNSDIHAEVISVNGSSNLNVTFYASNGTLVYTPSAVIDAFTAYGDDRVTGDIKQCVPEVQSVPVLATPWIPFPALWFQIKTVLQFVGSSDNIQSCRFVQTMEQRLQNALRFAEKNTESNLTVQILNAYRMADQQAVTLVYFVKNQSALVNGTMSSNLLNKLSAELVGFYLSYPPLIIAEPLEYPNFDTSLATEDYWVITVILGVTSSSLGNGNQTFARLMEQRLADLFTSTEVQGRRFRRATSVGMYTVQMVRMQRIQGSRDPAELTYYALYNGEPLLGTAAAKQLSTIDPQRMALTLGYVVLIQADPVVKNPPNKLWIIAAVLAPIAVVTVIIIIITAVLCRKNKSDFKPDTMANLHQRTKPVQGFDYAKQHLGQQGTDEDAIPVTQETVVLPLPVRDAPLPQDSEIPYDGSTTKTTKSSEARKSRLPSENGSVLSSESGKPHSGRSSLHKVMAPQKMTKEEARKKNGFRTKKKIVPISDEEEGAILFEHTSKNSADPFDSSSGSVQLIAIRPMGAPLSYSHPVSERSQDSAIVNGEVNKALKQKSDIEHYRNKLRLKAKRKGYYDFPPPESSNTALTEKQKKIYEKAQKDINKVLAPESSTYSDPKNRQTQTKNSIYRSRQSLNSPSPGETEMDLLVSRERPRRGIRNSGYDTEPELIEETNVDRVVEPRSRLRSRQVKGHSETSTLSSQPSIDEVRQQMHLLLEEAFSLASAGQVAPSRQQGTYNTVQQIPYSEVVTSAPGTMTRPRAGMQWVPTYGPEVYQYSLPRPSYRFSQLPEMAMGSPPPPVPPRTGPVAVTSLKRCHSTFHDTVDGRCDSACSLSPADTILVTTHLGLLPANPIMASCSHGTQPDFCSHSTRSHGHRTPLMLSRYTMHLLCF
ncbi:UPF0606 protein KIAA1549L homolog [Protopterus annectens]|uniref:UPF0606 protein KIAA1549L homolog n=1 Tax=Protopterus annectens TaxID=7888 RepID=UPI001CFC0087|nr:UPF0606 protein KIAA1549L homolog [Protopterus annectens]